MFKYIFPGDSQCRMEFFFFLCATLSVDFRPSERVLCAIYVPFLNITLHHFICVQHRYSREYITRRDNFNFWHLRGLGIGLKMFVKYSRRRNFNVLLAVEGLEQCFVKLIRRERSPPLISQGGLQTRQGGLSPPKPPKLHVWALD